MCSGKTKNNVKDSATGLKRCGLRKINRRIRQRLLMWFGHVRKGAARGVLDMIEGVEVPRRAQQTDQE